MYGNEIINDFAQRCGGEAAIGVASVNMQDCGVFATKLAQLSNLRVTVLEDTASASNVNAVIFLLQTSDLNDENNQNTQAFLQNAKWLNVPYIIVVNGDQNLDNSRILRGQLQEKFGVSVVFIALENADDSVFFEILKELLFEFSISSFDVKIPEWMRYLSAESSAIAELIFKIKQTAEKICKMKDCVYFDEMLLDSAYWQPEVLVNLNLALGKAEITVLVKDGIFFEMLSEIAGEEIVGESGLMGYIKSASEAKRGYGKIKDALECAKVNGYGIVQPDDSDMSLESPQVVRHGSSVGIKLKATAPSYHIIKVDVSGEASPIMGSANESEQIVKGMMAGFESNPEEMWDTNVFGKSLKSMVKDGLSGKVTCMQNDTKTKLRRAITRIINEGKGGVICILL